MYCMVFAPFIRKYNHGKCVTFGADSSSKEDVESYSWPINKFVKCMGNAPYLIIIEGFKNEGCCGMRFGRHTTSILHVTYNVEDS